MTNSLQGSRILIADDHAMVRLGFRLLLEGAGATVVGEAESGEGMLRLYAELTPDVVVMDVSMPGIGGLAALERLMVGEQKARVLMLSAHHDDVVPDEFLRAVTQVARNQRYLDPELAQAVALAQLSGAATPLETLTEKEFAVFMQLAQGRSVNDVAADFFLSPSTVGTHLYHIKQKLNLQNAAEMALLAMRSGLIEA